MTVTIADELGPIQAKKVRAALRSLDWEAKTFEEVLGVIGGDESRHVMTSLFTPPRPPERVAALAEALDAIATTYPTITRENYRDVIAAVEAATAGLAKSRPVNDLRRTPEEETERAATVKAATAIQEVQQAERTDAWDAIKAKAPTGAHAVIVAVAKVDNSDTQTDYFSNTAERTVAIGWRFSKREDFRALHAAAASFPETAHLADEDTLRAWAEGWGGSADYIAEHAGEHRDNYSMGAGNYLSDHGWDGAGSGWIVRSQDLAWGYHSQVIEDALPEQATAAVSAAAAVEGVTISPSSLGRAGVVEVRFADKPGPDVLAAMKASALSVGTGQPVLVRTGNQPSRLREGADMSSKALTKATERLTPGTVLEVIEHTKRPELVGSRRTITGHTHARVFECVSDHGGVQTESAMELAAGNLTWLDDDTITYPLLRGKGPRGRTHHITLRFIQKP